jgi:hypothetical protein
VNLFSFRADGDSRATALLLLAGLAWASTPTVRGQDAPAPVPEASPEAVARFEGVASPGLQITLKADRSSGRDLHYRWVQTRGAAASLDQPEGRDATLTVPEGAEPLGFLLVVGNARGVASSSLTIPIESPGTSPRDSSLKADAGDDLVGFVGRQITLNGIRSEPRGRIGYRWVQAGGPQVALKLESGCYYTFVPPAPGPYQFALVVASGDRISEPDYVSIAVSPTPTEPTPTPTPTPVPVAVKPAAPSQPPASTEELTRASVRSIDGGVELAPELSQVFSDIAGRMDLYKSYEEAYSEMSRRLDAVVPRLPDRRAVWTEKLFIPLTLRMIETLRAEGLDLTRPQGQSAPLTREQRKRLADHFRSMAEGFGRATNESNGPKGADVRPGR